MEKRPSLFINDPYPFRVDEDCLYLNIFTPKVSFTILRLDTNSPSINKSKMSMRVSFFCEFFVFLSLILGIFNACDFFLWSKLKSLQLKVSSIMKYPVIVFFHGGNFQTGSANEWPGHVLSSRGIVVVTVNYRLGPFGFMSLGDWETGNYGLQVFF